MRIPTATAALLDGSLVVLPRNEFAPKEFPLDVCEEFGPKNSLSCDEVGESVGTSTPSVAVVTWEVGFNVGGKDGDSVGPLQAK